ncbi:hypothetical protein BTO06_14705 [Tenacibaculum sp. SZ-18]|uniref:M28 family peptidase n=1 Tax=Tenacibaculum sp. SZ-18 TaxID=754423 RepID=UPI000C2CEB2B|nr:M28 family peptidase [Tenacibaculum sp. SZ-18]AUC16322.1 hypothetical protein BTO06_14705 [Tenacibaculum sp. SZ-18]
MNTTNRTLTLFILIAAIYWGFHDMKPSYNNENIIAQDELSVNNALNHLKRIAVKPHHVGIDEHKKVQTYLFKELQKIGLQPEIQTATVFNKKWKAGTTVENIIAKIKGTSNGKSLVVASHYDSSPHSSIGAADAGSGIVTILEGIRAYLAQNKVPKNDIIILFSDAEELGLLGAEAFVQYHPEAKNVGLVLNFEARGSGGPSYMLMETNGKNSILIDEFLKANPNFPAANSLMYSVYKMLPNDTDLTVFREGGNINGFNFAFIGDHFDYHTVQDNYVRLDRSSLAHQKDYFVSNLKHFSEIDLSKLNSNEDYVFVNFPFLDLLTFPFKWILPLIVFALILTFSLIIFGIKNKKLTIKGIFNGVIPFKGSVILVTLFNWILWEIILFIHPGYQDILHGFTYNGYMYISAFCLLDIWLIFKIYQKFTKVNSADLLVFPILFWIIINVLIYFYLKGAAFFLLPTFIGIISLAILIFGNKKPKNLILGILAIPTLYIFAPLIKMFPVGLGLKNLFISGLFIALVTGLVVPVFHTKNRKNSWTILAGIGAIVFFLLATFNSGFSIEKRKPNSLVYIQDVDTKKAYWGTYNKTLDNYTQQIFDKSFSKGSIENAETTNKYSRKFNYQKQADYKEIKTSLITTNRDTVVGSNRSIWLTLTPQRDITTFEIINNNNIKINSLTANGVNLYNKVTDLKRRTLLTYHLGNQDKQLELQLDFEKNQELNLIINEISNDLLTHPKFNLKPREDHMMPMPFVTNDAIISSKQIIIN